MVISLALPRTHLTVWVQALGTQRRRHRATDVNSLLVAPVQEQRHERGQHVVPPPNPYALDFEAGEPTWEDAEWQ